MDTEAREFARLEIDRLQRLGILLDAERAMTIGYLAGRSVRVEFTAELAAMTAIVNSSTHRGAKWISKL